MFFQLRKWFFISAFPMVVFGSFLALSPRDLYAGEKILQAVATTTTYANLIKEVGGDKVTLNHVASPKFNVHSIQPKPSDVRNVLEADLFAYTGLDLEMWMDPLVEAAGKPQFFRGRERSIDLSRNIPLLEVPTHQISRSEGDLHIFGNPHYWMSPQNAKIMTQTILEKLVEIDPDNTSYYEQNTKDFISRLDSKMAEWKTLCADCTGKEVVSYHRDSEYLADFLGIKINQYIEPKPGIPPTPKHMQFLEGYMKKNHVKIIIRPTFYPVGSAEAVAERAGGKTVTICQNVGELPGLTDYIALMDFNVKQLSEAFKTS